MKKILFLFSAISLVLASCSSSDDNNDNNDKPTVDDTVLILPQTEKYTSASHPEENNITTYTYNGNKIVSVDYSEGNKTTFTYTGNVITKSEYFENNILMETTTLTYENNKLKSYLKVPTTASSSRVRTDYTYNTDGTITSLRILIDPITQVETIDLTSVLTLDTRGNIIKIVFDDYVDVAEYDTKNNPFKNILGYTLLLDAEIFDQDVNSGNNLTKTTGEKNGITVEIATYENSYNNNDFLTKQVSNGETFEYTY
ncbi:hypothetical protein [Flavobacterium sp. 140616W15]|uniref:hypothetical protein n=1 Tax=Flavobacterium sp. 140616W15 TaxID=2478552 RepID=UPI000F0CF10E|nr:hypothetical protein [Flavobacterium sp. 140616W15]AYN03307.1 hypothetical protein EAG11_03310 [Flavobacterium sp. 140616W15]